MSQGHLTDCEGFQGVLRSAQAGDREAMDRVLSILRPHMERLAHLYADPLRPVHSTADLLQESCLRVWQKLPSFQGGEADEETFAMFRVWVGQIVRRLGMNARRDQATCRRSPRTGVVPLRVRRPTDTTTKRRHTEPPAPGPTPSARLRATERDERVEHALNGLGDRAEAEMVRMHFVDKLTLPEISRRLGLDFAKVRRLYRAAMRRLGRDLQPQE
jgi:RNA polymerase sigma factor (sigma-70 family)